MHLSHKLGAYCQRFPASSWPNAKGIRFIDQKITYQGCVSYAVHCWYFHICDTNSNIKLNYFLKFHVIDFILFYFIFTYEFHVECNDHGRNVVQPFVPFWWNWLLALNYIRETTVVQSTTKEFFSKLK